MTARYKICIVEDDNKKLHKSWKVVLLDIILPAYDGFYWCEKIRRFIISRIKFFTYMQKI
jgi:DNA-binding response OmpR family regulator